MGEESEVAKKVQNLLEQEETVLARALARTMKAYNESATTKNLKEWDAAKKRYEEFQRHKAAAADPEARRFKTLAPEVLEYLKAESWKVEKSKLYDDADRGALKKEKDGAYSKASVDKYANKWLEKLDGTDKPDDGLMTRKARLEIEILEEKKKEIVRENEIDAGKWVLRSDVESMFAGRASLLKNGLGPEFIHSHAPQIATLVGGDHAKVPDLIEYWLKAIEEHFDRYSKPVEFAAPVSTAREEEEGE